MTKKQQASIKRLWKQGRNIWEISQVTGVAERDVTEFVRTL